MTLDYLYSNMVTRIKSMTQEQLLELMHDINDVETIELIREEADYWLDLKKHEGEEDDDDGEMSDEEDAISVDDARRRRELR